MLEQIFGARLKTRYAEPRALRALVRDADVVIGAVLLPGKLSPKLIEQVHGGHVTHRDLATDIKRPFVSAMEALA